MQNKDVLGKLSPVDLLSCPYRRLLSRVSLHIAHAKSALRSPVTNVNIPMTRLIFASVDKLLEKVAIDDTADVRVSKAVDLGEMCNPKE